MKKNRFKRKIRNSILCMASFAIISSLGGGVRAEKFKDMPNNWSRGALERAIENNLIMGNNGRIRPDDSLTRAEMATIIGPLELRKRLIWIVLLIWIGRPGTMMKWPRLSPWAPLRELGENLILKSL